MNHKMTNDKLWRWNFVSSSIRLICPTIFIGQFFAPRNLLLGCCIYLCTNWWSNQQRSSHEKIFPSPDFPGVFGFRLCFQQSFYIRCKRTYIPCGNWSVAYEDRTFCSPVLSRTDRHSRRHTCLLRGSWARNCRENQQFTTHRLFQNWRPSVARRIKVRSTEQA